jgi:hypothetical protein
MAFYRGTGGTGTGSVTTLPVQISEGGTGGTNAADARTNLGLGNLALQNTTNVSITGGNITGITDLAVADGGTGASTAAQARSNLGLGTAATANTGDFATAAQGTLASTAVQPGDNISDLTNDAGFITTYTETDPIFSASVAAGISASDIIDWDTAFGWGDHAAAGYLVSGDNISVLVNDVGYLASGDNISLLVNDSNYLTDASTINGGTY